MKFRYYLGITIFGLVAFLLLDSCSSNLKNRSKSKSSKLNTHDIERIVLVGCTLISGMEQHAFFEQAMVQYFAGRDLLGYLISLGSDN